MPALLSHLPHCLHQHWLLQAPQEVHVWGLREPRLSQNAALLLPVIRAIFLPLPVNAAGASCRDPPATLAFQHLEEISVIGKPGELIVHFLLNVICLKKIK